MKNQLRNAAILVLIAIVCIIFSYSGNEESHSIQIYDAFDTYSEISASGRGGEKALTECREVILKYHNMWNDKSDDSEISKLNKEAGKKSVKLSEDTIDILKKSKFYTAETNGFFDITVGSAAELWDISGNPHIPSNEELADVIHKIGFDILEVYEDSAYLKKDGAKVTLGAIAKGYVTDKLIDVLKKHKIHSALINLGGNVYALGNTPSGKAWSIGIADPKNDGDVIGTLNIANKAVITSAGNYRYFETDGVRYHHILNPYTASPANSGLLSVTIISANPTEADVLSTACFVIGYTQSLSLLKEYNAEAVFVTDTGEVYYSEGIADMFEYDNDAYEYNLAKMPS